MLAERVACAYWYGAGIAGSGSQALSSFRRACDLDETYCGWVLGYGARICETEDSPDSVGYACAELARLYARGLGVERNPAKAKSLTILACMLGEQASCRIATSSYECVPGKEIWASSDRGATSRELRDKRDALCRESPKRLLEQLAISQSDGETSLRWSVEHGLNCYCPGVPKP